MRNETNFNILNKDLDEALDGLKSNVLGLDKPLIEKFADKTSESFKEFFIKVYDKDEMTSFNNNHGATLVLYIKDPNGVNVTLDMTHMYVEKIESANSPIIGHTHLDKFKKWFAGLAKTEGFDVNSLELEFKLLHSGIEYPTWKFKAHPNAYVLDDEMNLYMTEGFVPIDAETVRCISSITGDIKEFTPSKWLEGNETVVAMGMASLHSLEVTTYDEIVDFIANDKMKDVEDIDGKRAINDMLAIMVKEWVGLSKEKRMETPALDTFIDIAKIDYVVSDFIVNCIVNIGLQGFGEIAYFLKTKKINDTSELEEYLKTYADLSVLTRGHISTFFALPSDIIEACLCKHFKIESYPTPATDYRVYFHSIIWGTNNN